MKKYSENDLKNTRGVMDKVYIVTQGQYSAYHICAVWDTEQKAQAYINAFNEEEICDKMKIEEYDLNHEDYSGKKFYEVRMKRNGDVVDIEQKTSHCYNEKDEICRDILICHIIAKDEKHAIKIVNERRAQLIAENKWI